MKRLFVAITALFLYGCAVFSSAAANEQLAPWQKGNLDIHLIATGSGENTFVVMPDGTTMLIDAGVMKEESLVKGKTPQEIVADYIRHFSPHAETLDYFFLTHFHSDHMNGVESVGDNFKIRKIVDRDYPRYDYPSAAYIKDRCNKAFMGQYIDWIGAQTDAKGADGEKFVVGSHRQFKPVHAEVGGFDIFNVAGGGYISTGHGLLTRPFSADDPENFDENMFSCAILMRYGPFTYYTGGDIPGSNWYVRHFKNGKAVSEEMKANGKVTFREFESQVAELVAPVTAMKLNHHGVPDGTTAEFLWKMRPEVMCVCGSGPKQPSPTTLRRIADPQLPCAHKVYVTSDRARESNGNALWKETVNPVGHIVIRVTDGGRNYQVFVLDAVKGGYSIIHSTPLTPVATPRRNAGPDSVIPVSDDFGQYDAAFDSVFNGVPEYTSTDELHSMIVLKNGKKIYEHYDTGHEPSERHVMWSASKTFTSVAVGFAVQDGLLSIDDKVISFFRDDELPAERSEWLCKMTVRDLLTMSSGLGTDGINKLRSGIWKHPAIEAFAAPMVFEPGTKYKYNSMNTYLLSEIVQRRTGLKVSEYLTRKLFRPLGICNWEWEESADGVTAGGWGLYTTTENFAKFGQFLLQKGEWEGRRLLDPAWIETLSSPHIIQHPDAPSEGDDWNSGYGYQVWVCTHGAYRADGAHGQFCIVIPEKNAVIAIHAQMHNGKRNLMKLIWEKVYPLL